MKRIITRILSPLSENETIYLPEVELGIEEGKIASIKQNWQAKGQKDMREYLCLPGFIDLHVHLSQYRVRGRYAPDLLSWLHKYVFPAEQKSSNKRYARQIAEEFYFRSAAKGTTTSVVYTAPFAEACEAAFEAAERLGVRSIIGMTMMDCNSPDYLQQSTAYAVERSFALWEKWHDKPLLDYIFTPRFAITCSSDLMKETGKIIQSHQARLQTHLSENNNEIGQVRKMFPEDGSYTEVYARHDLLSSRSIMGHGIHLKPHEMDLLADSGSSIAYCPDSNLFLKSGRIRWHKLEEKGIKAGLASDVGAGTDLSMLKMMKCADYMLDKPHIDPQKALYLGTLRNAEILGWQDMTGSVAPGKSADLVFIKLPEELRAADKDELLSWLVYLNQEVEIVSTWVAGKEVYKKENISGGKHENS